MKTIDTPPQNHVANRTARGTSCRPSRGQGTAAGQSGAVTADRDFDGDFAKVKSAGTVSPASGLAISCLTPERNWAHNPAPLTSPRSNFLLTEQLVQIWSSNERDLAELRGLRFKAAQARAYLASPGCNRSLGLSYLERLETTRRIHLARLRANRRSAWQLLSQLDHKLPPSVSPNTRLA